MAKARKDNKGRVLRTGEQYRPKEGRYLYTYLDSRKKRRTIYSVDLMKLREREDEIKRDQLDGIDNYIRGHVTVNQQKAFMDFIDGHPVFDHWSPAFTVLLGTGCRCGEFIGLRWEDIDMENRMISINHALVRAKKSRFNKKERMTVSLPKTEAGIRTIPMLDQVYEAFDRVYKEQCETGFNETEIDGMSGFIFKNEQGNVLSEQNINAAIRRITEAYNMKEEVRAARERREPELLPNFSCHYLRHTFCTRFCENETNLKVIQSVMGHKNIKTTMEVYAECTDEKKKEAMQNLSAKWKDF